MMQPAMKPVEEHSPSDIIARIGSLTRMLRDSLRELGLDQAIAEAAEAIPDARDRLDYVVQMTAQAAERALALPQLTPSTANGHTPACGHSR